MNTVALSLGISAAATLVVTLLAVPLAYSLGRTRFAGQSTLEAFFTLPLVLPPTVVGYFLVVTFGAQGWIGSWLRSAFDYTLLFRVEAAILAAAVVAFPLLYLPARAAFASVEHELEDVAALLGANRWQTFWHVSLPMARQGILSGQVLAFARALGEFGATVMAFGWQPGRQTMPISIYAAYTQGDLPAALPLVLAMTAICIVLLILFNRVTPRPPR